VVNTRERKPDPAAPIGVFDSGVGGLSVLREVRRQLPNEALLYVADSGFAPYGERSAAYIEQRSVALAEFLVSEGAKAIVVACNTATAAIAPTLRQRWSRPVVAIEPAVKPAARVSRSGVIGVLATRQTLSSPRFSRLVTDHATGVDVLSEPCPDLVSLVERGVIRGPEAAAAVERHVRALLERRADVIVLGCTHFHFLRAVVEAVAGAGVTVIDPGAAVALELRRRLDADGLLGLGPPDGPDGMWTSGELEQGRELIARLWPSPVDVRQLPPAYCVPPRA
jgi:glutamate racemase